MNLPFTEKQIVGREPGWMFNDPVRGLARLAPDVREVLDWLAALVAQRKWHPLIVTELGRTAADNEALYLPSYLQELCDQHDAPLAQPPPQLVEEAKAKARARFSWHLIGLDTAGRPDTFRAFDLRAVVHGSHGRELCLYPEPIRAEMTEALRRRFAGIGVLYHAIVGGAVHFHVQRPGLSRPVRWA